MPADPSAKSGTVAAVESGGVLRGISSMATRALLAERMRALARAGVDEAAIESVGGIDAARRVRSGESVDLIILASDAIDALEADGHVRAGSKVDWVRSEVAVAVPAGTPRLDISSEEALRRAVEAAKSIGYSTGPSGKALLALFVRWGLAEAVAAKTVQAPPGIPVGRLMAEGRVALGFQQVSELMGLPGIDLIGTLPDAIRVVTTFSGAVASTSQAPEAAAAWLHGLIDPAATDVVLRHGMVPA